MLTFQLPAKLCTLNRQMFTKKKNYSLFTINRNIDLYKHIYKHGNTILEKYSSLVYHVLCQEGHSRSLCNREAIYTISLHILSLTFRLHEIARNCTKLHDCTIYYPAYGIR